MGFLHPLNTDVQAPERFTYPFCYEPHPLCEMAAKEVQTYIAAHVGIKEDADRGKMLGVLVVECDGVNGGLGFLAAYSGLLAGRNDWEYFVPPVYDAQQPDGHFKTMEREISRISRETSSTSNASSTRWMSQDLQLWLFHQYELLNEEENRKIWWISGSHIIIRRNCVVSSHYPQAVPVIVALLNSCSMRINNI